MAQRRGHNQLDTFAVAALTAAAYLPWLILGLPAGAWVDRWPCRPLMIICDVVSALLYASLPVAAWLGVLTTGQVVLVALAAGSCTVFFATAYRVYLPSLVSAADLIEGNAKLQGSAVRRRASGRCTRCGTYRAGPGGASGRRSRAGGHSSSGELPAAW
jgi:MFS family permease